MNVRTNFKIYGSGPTGAILAIALAKYNFSSVIIDPNSSIKIQSRSRAYAITHSSRKLLQELNLWKKLSPFLTSFNRLLVINQSQNQSLLFTSKDLSPENLSDNSVGWIIDHSQLMTVLFDEINKLPQIVNYIGRDSKDSNFIYEMEIAADGSSSSNRKRWGINKWRTSYKTGCVTAQILLRGTPANSAYEILREEGPLALLPIGGDKFQLVLTTSLIKCIELTKLPNHIFLDRLAGILPSGFEPDVVLDELKYFPLELSVASSLSKGKSFLVGESAHRCHPVGGQGLNVCWRDVSTLVKLLNRDFFSNSCFRNLGFKYSLSRYPDILFVSLFTHLITLIYSGNNKLILILRYPILYIMKRNKLIRVLVLKLMTDGLMHIL